MKHIILLSILLSPLSLLSQSETPSAMENSEKTSSEQSFDSEYLMRLKQTGKENLKTQILATGWYHVSEDSTSFEREMFKGYESLFLHYEPILIQENLEDLSIGYDNYGRPVMNLAFDANGTLRWSAETKTAALTKARVAFIVDDKLISAPSVYSQITGGKCQVSGDQYSVEELQALLARIKGE